MRQFNKLSRRWTSVANTPGTVRNFYWNWYKVELHPTRSAPHGRRKAAPSEICKINNEWSVYWREAWRRRAERVVNSRPLTIESEEAEALTQNHFLLLSPNGVKLTSEYTEGKPCSELHRREVLGKLYELIQSLLDAFLKRWLIEYLLVIRRQAKCFNEQRVESAKRTSVTTTSHSYDL